MKWNIKNNVSGESKKPRHIKHKEFNIPAKSAYGGGVLEQKTKEEIIHSRACSKDHHLKESTEMDAKMKASQKLGPRNIMKTKTNPACYFEVEIMVFPYTLLMMTKTHWMPSTKNART